MGIYLVMKNSFKRCFHHKLLFAVTLLLPVILCLAAGIISFGKPSLRVGILGPDSASFGKADQREVFRILDQSEGVTYARADKDSFNTDLIMGKYQVILDYRESSQINGFHLITLQSKQKKSLLEVMFTKSFTDRAPIKLTGLKPERLSVTERDIALLLSLFMILSTVHASGIIRDRQNGTLLRYRYVYKDSSGYIIGWILYDFLITYIQVLLCTAALVMIQGGFRLTGREVLLIPAIIAAISAVFAELISLGSKSEVQSNITASALAAIMSLLGGTFVAVESMPGLLKLLSFISPVRWIIELIRII